jgi:hypothetical protein
MKFVCTYALDVTESAIHAIHAHGLTRTKDLTINILTLPSQCAG